MQFEKKKYGYKQQQNLTLWLKCSRLNNNKKFAMHVLDKWHTLRVWELFVDNRDTCSEAQNSTICNGMILDNDSHSRSMDTHRISILLRMFSNLKHF